MVTGTGIWALNFAREHPSSLVVGTDLSAIQPITSLPNVEFVVENSETQEWLFPEPFDFIHIRSMGPCFNDFMTVIQKCYRHVSPGGWLELQDGSWELQSPDGSLQGTALERWYQLLISGGARSGRDMIKSKFYKSYLECAGFSDVEERIIPLRVGGWPGNLLESRSLYFAIGSYRKLILATGLSAEETDALLDAARKDVLNPRINFHINA
jgi:trans-aconitate methyltransferase